MAKHIPDKKILAWIESGEIRITHISTRRPRLVFRGRTIKATIVESNGRGRMPGQPRYRWELCDGSKKRGRRRIRRRRTIVCAKLVWMYSHRRTVPAGCQLHHGDEDRQNDSIENLECLNDPEHYARHHGERELDEVPF